MSNKNYKEFAYLKLIQENQTSFLNELEYKNLMKREKV